MMDEFCIYVFLKSPIFSFPSMSITVLKMFSPFYLLFLLYPILLLILADALPPLSFSKHSYFVFFFSRKLVRKIYWKSKLFLVFFL